MNAKQAHLRLAEVKSSACSCNDCVGMCRTRPCWGTPADIKKIVDAGYRNRLMSDYWAGTPDIHMLAPAIVGYEGRHTPWWPHGRCTFLTQDNKCELHELGLKPTEGRLADHHPDWDWLHGTVADTWRTKKAQLFAEKS